MELTHDLTQYHVLDGELIKYSGNDATVVVPSSINGEKIIAIGEKAFRDCNTVNEVVIEPGVRYIKNGAFSGCWNLRNVLLPDTVYSIGERGKGRQDQQVGAFADSGIERLEIPDGVEIIGPFAFANTRIQDMMIPNSVKEIGRSAFEGCTSLGIVKLPEDLITLESYTFKNCSALAEVIFSDRLHFIKSGVFSGNASIKELELPYGLLELASGVFTGCKNLTDLYVPFTVVRINDSNCFGYLYSYSQSVFPSRTTVHCHSQSFTRKYCEAHKINVVDWDK